MSRMSAWCVRAWDAVAAHIARHPRKYATLGFLIFFLPGWIPVARDAARGLWSLVSPPNSLSSILTLISWPEWSFSWWSLITTPIGALLMLLVWWETRRPPAKFPSGFRPSVLLSFDSPNLRFFKREDVAPNHLIVHNEGNPSALRVRFEPVVFHDTLRMEIDEIPMIGPYAKTEAIVRLVDDDGPRKRDVTSLGGALCAANLRMHFTGSVPRELRTVSWPLKMAYLDADGNEYQREFILELDRNEMRARVVFEK